MEGLGGHIEPHETRRKPRRELFEESGIWAEDIDVWPMLAGL